MNMIICSEHTHQCDHGAYLKDKKHSHYLHDGNAIGFAFDSMGGIKKSTIVELRNCGNAEKKVGFWKLPTHADVSHSLTFRE